MNFARCDLSSILRVEKNDSTIFSFSGDSLKLNDFGEYYIFPTVSFWAQIKMWGAGGGSNGGLGGYSCGKVYFNQGTKYIVYVGEGGTETGSGKYGTFGGGGLVGITMSSGVFVGTGGGLTGLFIESFSQSNSIIIAGGGGGGMIYNPWGVIRGGNGGGTEGERGYYATYPSYAGYGGTQTEGGARGPGGGNHGSLAGAPLQGGKGASTITGSYSGSGGGSGYFGGGGGTNGNYAGGPGGGGSGFIHSSLVTNGTTSQFIDDPERINNAGEKSQNGMFFMSLDSPINSPFHRTSIIGYIFVLQMIL